MLWSGRVECDVESVRADVGGNVSHGKYATPEIVDVRKA